jgi:hypothetical protein
VVVIAKGLILLEILLVGGDVNWHINFEFRILNFSLRDMRANTESNRDGKGRKGHKGRKIWPLFLRALAHYGSGTVTGEFIGAHSRDAATEAQIFWRKWLCGYWVKWIIV